MRKNNLKKAFLMCITLSLLLTFCFMPSYQVQADPIIQIRIVQGALYINDEPDTHEIKTGIEIKMHVSDGQTKTIYTQGYEEEDDLNFGTGFLNIDEDETINFTIFYDGIYIEPDNISYLETMYEQNYITIDSHDTYHVNLYINVTNTPPEVPTNETPDDNQENVKVNKSLSWDCSDPEDDPLTYDVYFGTNSTPNNGDKKSSNQSKTTYNPGNLDYDTSYYWKIVAYDNHSNQVSSPIWEFSTISNPSPFAPYNPKPENKSKDQPKNSILKWECSDEYDDELTYDVYFSRNSTLTEDHKKSSNQTQRSFDPAFTLKYNKTYYWKVIAWDEDGASNQSTLWHFTVSETNLPPKEPRNPSPASEGPNSIKINISTNLSWDGGDNDGDDIFYDIYFGTNDDPPLVKEDYTKTEYNPGQLEFYTTYYWKIVSRDAHSSTTSGPVWEFTTITESQGGGKPTADAGGPYTGSINEDIQFDASKSTDDINITGYRWDFTNDGTYDTNWLISSKTTHAYDSIFNGKVKLQVKDDENNYAIDTADVSINSNNYPPSEPTIEAPLVGYVNESFILNITANDQDDTELTITIDWNDDTTPTVRNAEEGEMIKISHTYTETNLYTVTVTVKDSKNAETEDTKLVSIQEREDNSDDNEEDEAGFPWLYLIIILIVVAVIIVIFFLYKQDKLTFIFPNNSNELNGEKGSLLSNFNRKKTINGTQNQKIESQPTSIPQPTTISASIDENDNWESNNTETDLEEDTEEDADDSSDFEFKRL